MRTAEGLRRCGLWAARVFALGAVVPALGQQGAARPVCAVIPFENLTGQPGSAYLADVIHLSLCPALERTGVWQLVERDQLGALQVESDLKASGATGKQIRVKGADVLVIGEYRDEEGMVTVSARLADGVTSKVIRRADWAGHVSGLCDAMGPRLAAALADEPPPADGLPAKAAARFRRACRYLQQGQVDRAIEACDAILEAHRQDVPTLLLRGHAALQKKGWSNYAVKDFEKVLELDEDNAAARLGLARAKLGGDRRTVEQAIPWLREVIEDHPGHGEAVWLLATAFERVGRLAEAEQAARRSAELLPDFGPAWRTLARVQLSQGRLADAGAAVIRATQCDPDEAASWMLLGDVQAETDDRDAARTSWARALKCDPPPEMKRRLEARMQRFD